MTKLTQTEELGIWQFGVTGLGTLMEVSVSTGFYGVLIGISEDMDHLKGGSCRVYGVLIGVPSSGVFRKIVTLIFGVLLLVY